MKRLVLSLTMLAVLTTLGAQSLEEIARKNYEATGQAAFAEAQTVTIHAKAYQGGMEIPMVISMKKPDKVRITMTFQGMEIIQAYDGVKGYMVNPMMGSSEAVELPPAEAANMKNQANFTTNLTDYLKDNKLEMVGDADVGGKSAWKIKIIMPTGDIAYIYIDKASYRQLKSDMSVSQMGMEINIETYLADYATFNGLMLPKTTTSYANGTEMMMVVIEKAEVNLPMDDKIFIIK
ncbi:MAG: hypothetical protein RBS37_02055 [Bacteroidales bacterium]|nr:hypothetical protein [Bacteroidales bacterium]